VVLLGKGLLGSLGAALRRPVVAISSGLAAVAVIGTTVLMAGVTGVEAQSGPPVYNAPGNEPSFGLSVQTSTVTPSAGLTWYGSPSSPTAPAVSDRIDTLARSLEDNPDRIYQFVYNTIAFEPQFGLHKGADGVLLDGSGGSFDQAHLMVSLLRAAGYSARYVYGTVTLGAEAKDILKVDTARQACLLLATAGTPALVNGSSTCTSLTGSVTSVEMLHVWVEASIGGTWYAFDPSLKQNTRITGIDLWGAMGTNASSAWSNVSSGVSTSSGTVLGLNQANIDADMKGYTTDLQNAIIASHSDKSLKQITGGWEIQRTEAGPRVTSLSGHSAASGSPWTGDIPTAFRATLKLETPGFSNTWDLPSVYAWRMQAQLVGRTLRTVVRKCDAGNPGAADDWGGCGGDTAVAGTDPGATAFSANGQMLSLTLNHPYAAGTGTFGDETTLKELEIGKRADIIVRTAGGLGSRRPLQAAAVDPMTALRVIPAGNPYECDFPAGETPPPTAEACDGTQASDWTYWNDLGTGAFPAGEVAVAEMGSKKDALINLWADLFDRTTAILQGVSGARIFHQHSLGIAVTPGNAINALDVNTNVGIAPAGSDDPHHVLAALAVLSSAEEGMAIQQSAADHPQGSGGTISVAYSSSRRLADGSTLKLLTTTGSTSGLPSGVNADTRVEIEKYLTAGYSVIVNTTADTNAFLARSADGSEQAWIVRRIGASNNPAITSQASFRKGATDGAPNPLDFLGKAEGRMIAANVAGTHLGAVDLRSGTLSFGEGTEISVGQGDFPYSLSFSRSYSSTGPVEGRGDLGMGWSHNWMSSAVQSSDVNALFPDGEAVTAAPTIVGVLIALQAGRTDTIQSALIAGVALNWWQDQAIANVVNVSGGGRSARFVRLANGTWRNPSSPTEELAAIDGESPTYGSQFNWTMADKSVMEFRRIMFDPNMPGYDEVPHHYTARNAATKWTFPTGVIITLAYSNPDETNTPYLTTVSNNLGATLTFTHQTNPTEVQAGNCEANAAALAYGGGRREAQQECYILSRSGGLLNRVSAGNDQINFGYSNQCPKNTNFCAFTLVIADRPGLRKREYVYAMPTGAVAGAAGDYTLYQNMLTRIVDDGVTTPRARFEWKAKGTEIAPYVAESYDAQNRMTTYYSSGLTYSSAKDALNGVVRQTYDEDGRLAASADAMGRTSRATYDGPGRSKTIKTPYGDISSFQYDPRGNLTQRTQTPVDGCATGLTTAEASWWCQTIVIRAEYHATWNKPTKVILPATTADPNEREWTISYNSQGLTYQTTGPSVWDAVGNANAQPVWTTWYDAYGRVTKTKDPTGIEATQTWGGGGLPAFCLRESRASTQLGGISGMTTTFVCDAVGNVTSVTDALGRTATTTYDNLRRKTATTGPVGTNIQTQWVYDLNGDMTQEKRWDHAASTWRTMTTTYSATHKPLTVTDPSGDLTRTCYDDLDRPTTVIDPMLRATITDYNSSGQPTAVRRWHIANANSCTTAFVAPPGSGQTEDRWRRFGYNAAGMQTEETDARGNVTTVAYDGLGRPFRTIYPDVDGIGGAAATEAWTMLDQRGQVVTRKQRGGTWAALYYDAMGRDYHVQEFNNGSTGFAGRNTRAAYDLAGRPIWRDVSTQTSTGMTWDDTLLRDVRNYAYDTAGRLVTDQVKPEGIGSGALTLSLWL
jgi:YD repeat-containing protein